MKSKKVTWTRTSVVLGEHRAREQAVVSVGARYLAPSGRVWEVRSLLPHDRVMLTTPGPDGDCGAVVDVEAVARMIPLPLTLDGAGTLMAERSPGSAPSEDGARPGSTQSAPAGDIGDRVA